MCLGCQENRQARANRALRHLRKKVRGQSGARKLAAWKHTEQLACAPVLVAEWERDAKVLSAGPASRRAAKEHGSKSFPKELPGRIALPCPPHRRVGTSRTRRDPEGSPGTRAAPLQSTPSVDCRSRCYGDTRLRKELRTSEPVSPRSAPARYVSHPAPHGRLSCWEKIRGEQRLIATGAHGVLRL